MIPRARRIALSRSLSFGLAGVVIGASLGIGSTAHAANGDKPARKAQAATSPSTLASCSWDRPNQNPYMGELPAALDRFADLPTDLRERLKQRVAMQQYDDMVEIRRDAILGKGVYEAQIRDMHFGQHGTVCKTVSRKKWLASTVERGLVYCEGAQCVLVPTVCRNVSRITRLKPADVAAAAVPTPPVASDKPQGAAMAAEPVAITTKPSDLGPTTSVAAAPAFADVVDGPVFAFPLGPSGSTGVIAPPVSGGDLGGGGSGGGVVPGPGGGGGGAVGGVIVTPVPEPSTWAMMIVGLLLLGQQVRSRARASR